MHNFLNSRSARILTVVLLAQASLFYGFSRRENIPVHNPLSAFHFDDPQWTAVQDIETDPETLEVLKADDLITRVYRNTQSSYPVTLFIAYFETQHRGWLPRFRERWDVLQLRRSQN